MTYQELITNHGKGRGFPSIPLRTSPNPNMFRPDIKTGAGKPLDHSFALEQIIMAFIEMMDDPDVLAEIVAEFDPNDFPSIFDEEAGGQFTATEYLPFEEIVDRVIIKYPESIGGIVSFTSGARGGSYMFINSLAEHEEVDYLISQGLRDVASGKRENLVIPSNKRLIVMKDVVGPAPQSMIDPIAILIAAGMREEQLTLIGGLRAVENQINSLRRIAPKASLGVAKMVQAHILKILYGYRNRSRVTTVPFDLELLENNRPLDVMNRVLEHALPLSLANTGITLANRNSVALPTLDRLLQLEAAGKLDYGAALKPSKYRDITIGEVLDRQEIKYTNSDPDLKRLKPKELIEIGMTVHASFVAHHILTAAFLHLAENPRIVNNA